MAEITEVIEAVGGGIAAGEVFEGQWRFQIMVRFPDDRRVDVETIAALWVTAPDGSRIPLRDLTDIRIVDGPAQISREHANRRIVIEANVIGRDLVGAVEEAEAAVGRLVQFPPNYYLTWGGQFENQQKAMARLAIVVPLVIALIFLLLFFTFGNLRQAALILLAIPFAMVGGLLALLLGGLYLSVPASVGFIALLAIQNCRLNFTAAKFYFRPKQEKATSNRICVECWQMKKRLRAIFKIEPIHSIILF